MVQPSQVRTYNRATSVVFLKTKERFGGLSNMAPGFPLRVNNVSIRTSEALYQACRFPHMPDVQRRIIDEYSPMTAKMRGKPYRKESRSDWENVRVRIMRWCLRVKLAQNRHDFGDLLLDTGARPIVEQSRKDDFWGTKVTEGGELVGMNVLGRLLMELREQLKGDEAESLRAVEPLPIPDFFLFETPIQRVCSDDGGVRPVGIETRPAPSTAPSAHHELSQPSFFDQPTINQAKGGIQENDCLTGSNREQAPGAYPTYRDSGLPWLGRVPEHWDVRRNGRLFAQRNNTGHKKLPVLEVSLRTGVRVRNLDDGARKQMMTDRGKYKRAAKGDIAYNMMRMWQGAVGVAPVDGLVSPAYVVASPFPEIESRYYSYLFQTGDYMREVNKFSRGIVSDRNRLYWDEFKQMPSAFPPTEEQVWIANFLDAQGRLTDRIIQNKRRLIALLNKKRQAIVNRAVTHGLDPNAPMKKTGIEWLHEVPARWQIRKIKQVCSVLLSNVDKHSFEHEEAVKLCNYVDVYKNDFVDSRITFPKATASEEEVARFRLQIGDVIITKDSETWNDIGVPAIVSEALGDVLCGYHLALLRPDQDEIVSPFLFRTLTADSTAQQFHISANGVTRFGLSQHAIKNASIPVPSLLEQATIVEYLKKTTADIDATINRKHLQIKLLHEYRERLIADVVTGKLDVRGAEVDAPSDEQAEDIHEHAGAGLGYEPELVEADA